MFFNLYSYGLVSIDHVVVMIVDIDLSGGSGQNVDRVLSHKNLTKNEIFVHFHSNLEILTGFQKPYDPVWIRHWISHKLYLQSIYLQLNGDPALLHQLDGNEFV